MVRLYGKVDFSIIDGDLYCANGRAEKNRALRPRFFQSGFVVNEQAQVIHL